MGKNRFDSLRTLWLYAGSKDERTQRLADRVGNYLANFLFLGFILDVIIKVFVLNQGVGQVLSELIILLSGGVFSFILYVRHGVIFFGSDRQKRKVRILFITFSIAVLSLASYLPLVLKLPSAQKIPDLDLVAWLRPIPFVIGGTLLCWLLLKLIDFLSKKNNQKLEEKE